jgi:hypothetical protein
MEKYNETEAHKQFATGRRLLDSGRYAEAIKIFSGLIEISQPHLQDKAAKITFETSLNNRGKAKCELGSEKRNKDLFEEGLRDYEQSVAASGVESESPSLTARRNLEIGRKELENWDRLQTGGFKTV